MSTGGSNSLEMKSVLFVLGCLSITAGMLAADTGNRPREVIHSAPGSWGKLEYYEVPLECPDSYIDYLVIPSQQTEWTYPTASFATPREMLAAAGLDGDTIERLMDEAQLISDEEVSRLYPTDQAVLDLPFDVRSRLYSFLSRVGDNPNHRRPIYINNENLSAWFTGSNAPRPAIQDVARLAYPTPRGKGYFLSDLPLTLRQATSNPEERTILQALLRRRGLIVRLVLDEGSLTPEIGDYWTAGYKNKAVMPIFESVVRESGQGSIDIAHLLPANAREYLNRFPTVADGISGRLPDWFWTCNNFFRFTPQNIYVDSPERDPIILRDFQTTAPPLQFGDMLLLHSGNDIIHGCIHIADDIVFTKNGPDLYSPWSLMKIDDVLAYHDLQGDVSMSVHRRIVPEPQGTR